MKKFKYILSVLLLFLVSCDSLLNISPRQEVKQSDEFSYEDGYKNSLIGIYIKMASSDLYGCNTSFYFTDLLAQTWSTSGSTTYEVDTKVKEWDFTYSKVEGRIETIWQAYYFAIMSANNILDNIDKSKGIFKNGNYELIKGEALGLRAFLHLEVLRHFGPKPGEAAGKQAIPYAEIFSKDPKCFLTQSYETVIEKIIRDLDAAELLLKNDPLIASTNKQLNDAKAIWDEKPLDSWQMKRQIRFNYWAVKAAKARYYDWIGDSAKAAEYAKEVIESGKFRLTNASDYLSSSDYTVSLVMLSEHIFGVHNPTHETTARSYFSGQSVRLTQSKANITLAYESTSDDIRNYPNRNWREQSYSGSAEVINHFLKYTGNVEIVSPNKIPVIRLAEMYFIAIGNLPVSDPDAKRYYTVFLNSRNIKDDNADDNLSSYEKIKERMQKEYIKEFMGEGQVWFFYKKNNIKSYSWPSNFNVPEKHADYVIPMPKSQTIFD